VKEIAEEYGVPYYSQKTFAGAVKSHAQMLYRLGRGETASPAIAK